MLEINFFSIFNSIFFICSLHKWFNVHFFSAVHMGSIFSEIQPQSWLMIDDLSAGQTLELTSSPVVHENHKNIQIHFLLSPSKS